MSACHVLLVMQGDGVGTCEAKRAGCHTLALTLPCTFRRMRCGPSGSVAAELAKSLVRHLPATYPLRQEIPSDLPLYFILLLSNIHAILYCSILLSSIISSAPSFTITSLTAPQIMSHHGC